MSWSTCPVCHGVVSDAQGHADWHSLQVAEAEALGGEPAPTVTTGDRWPEGLPVPTMPAQDPLKLSGLRAMALPWFTPVDATLAAIEDYLTTAPAPTTQLEMQVRINAEAIKGLLIATRSLIALTLRTED